LSDQVATLTQVEVIAKYLPSPDEFRQSYERTALLAPVRTAIMAFFGVQDRTVGRYAYTYYLSFEGKRQDDLNITLEVLVGNERHTAHFQLVEEIKEG